MSSQVDQENQNVNPVLTADQALSILKPFDFQDTKKASKNLQSIAGDSVESSHFSEIIEETLSALSEAPAPDQALNNFERFTKTTFSKTHLFSYLKASPKTLHQAAYVFGGSPFLSDILIRNPEYFYWIFNPKRLEQSKRKNDYRQELVAACRLLQTKQNQLDMLRIFKRKEILRIGVRDLLGITDVNETVRELSSLADVLIDRAYSICEKTMRQKYGRPQPDGRSKAWEGSGFSVLALGKLGSMELNFSSDVDLIYLYASRSGRTRGVKGINRIENADYFERLSKSITSALNEKSGQGYVYRVDLRLRPEGDKGPIALSLEGCRLYYAKRGEIWEGLALLRARAVAGDRELGKDFLTMASDFTNKMAFERDGRRAVRQCKEKIDEQLRQNNHLHRDIKRGCGGIREVEFLAQSLQLCFEKASITNRKIRIIEVIKRLRNDKRLSKESASQLLAAYRFLRDLENKLQMAHDQQTHLIPTDTEEIAVLARKMGFVSSKASEQFMKTYRFHTNRVHQIYNDFFYANAAI
ncbi:MAG: hypothetical protein ACE5GK_03760 [Nitrospiria bacterium]